MLYKKVSACLQGKSYLFIVFKGIISHIFLSKILSFDSLFFFFLVFFVCLLFFLFCRHLFTTNLIGFLRGWQKASTIPTRNSEGKVKVVNRKEKWCQEKNSPNILFIRSHVFLTLKILNYFRVGATS